MNIFIQILISLVSLRVIFAQSISVDPKTGFFVDEFSRVRIFHGVNAVYKVPPWISESATFNPFTSFTQRDVDNLSEWGFNAVRLGVMWPGVFPVSPNALNASYIAAVTKIINMLAAKDIYTIVDMHQDLISPKFCGEGAPDWLIPYPNNKGEVEFPTPVDDPARYTVNATNHHIESGCSRHTFSLFYLSYAVGEAFQQLYNNYAHMQAHLVDFWGNVSVAFARQKHVLGYELINEPWSGNVYTNPSILRPGYADRLYLQPMYELITTRIRAHDRRAMIFFEKALLPNQVFESGFTATPGGEANKNRAVLSYHVYCGSEASNKTFDKAFCNLANLEQFVVSQKDHRKLGIGSFMTEFGACYVPNGNAEYTGCADDTAYLLDLADSAFQSWTYWQFKLFHDVTTTGGNTESFYNTSGALQTHKVALLSRTYARAIAGTPIAMRFERHSARFELRFALNCSAAAVAPTEIYLNSAVHYASGFSVRVAPRNVLARTRPTANVLHFALAAGVACVDNTKIEIEITKK